MRIAILATKENVEAVRQRAKENLQDTPIARDTILSIPLSENGKYPVSHYFCSFKVTEDFYARLKQLEELSKIEEIDSIKQFLKDNNLKLISELPPKNENN